MASTHTGADTAAKPRVRDQAREVLALMAFSAVTSAALAIALTLLTGLGE